MIKLLSSKYNDIKILPVTINDITTTRHGVATPTLVSGH